MDIYAGVQTQAMAEFARMLEGPRAKARVMTASLLESAGIFISRLYNAVSTPIVLNLPGEIQDAAHLGTNPDIDRYPVVHKYDPTHRRIIGQHEFQVKLPIFPILIIAGLIQMGPVLGQIGSRLPDLTRREATPARIVGHTGSGSACDITSMNDAYRLANNPDSPGHAAGARLVAEVLKLNTDRGEILISGLDIVNCDADTGRVGLGYPNTLEVIANVTPGK